jgi:nitric oxide reductase subunit C
MVFYCLCAGFIIYTYKLWTQEEKPSFVSPQLVAEGKLVWQKHNCQSCHQFYGLGGYLGPDLTNEFERWDNNAQVIEAFIRSGNNRMPSYNLTQDEMKALLGFLEAMNTTGNADPRHFAIRKDGMIE